MSHTRPVAAKAKARLVGSLASRTQVNGNDGGYEMIYMSIYETAGDELAEKRARQNKDLTSCMGKQILRPDYGSAGICKLSAGLSSEERGGAPNGLVAIRVCIASVPWMCCQRRLALALEALVLRPWS